MCALRCSFLLYGSECVCVCVLGRPDDTSARARRVACAGNLVDLLAKYRHKRMYEAHRAIYNIITIIKIMRLVGWMPCAHRVVCVYVYSGQFLRLSQALASA